MMSVTDEAVQNAANTGGLRVLVVSNHIQFKGTLPFSGVFIERQVHSLRKAGVEIETFDLGASHAPIHLLRKWRELRRIAKAVRPQIVHARYGTVIAALSVLAGRPSVVTFCGSDLNGGASVSWLRSLTGRLLSNVAALKADRIICVSEGLRQALWWRRDRAVVIPDGVDTDLFTPGPRDAARRELGWKLDSTVVLFNLGDDAKKKGFDLAKAGVEAAHSRVPGLEFKVVQHVAPTQMPLYYRAADVLLCTSVNEGSPNVVKEALACNLPVVSVRVGDVEERLAGVEPSMLVARDADEIGRALAGVLLTKRRSNGREHVTSVALDEVARRVIAVYKAVSRPSGDAARRSDPTDRLRVETSG
jgi:teichuronic acid biosynthesis glycosyltransferase TuaC